MRVLLISTYELGHQPVHVASPAGAMRAAGHDVRALDLAVEHYDAEAVEWAEAVAFSVPMHTAMRLAMRAAERVRTQRPDVPICFYGLYAPVSRDLTVERIADRAIAGEYEPALLAWLDGKDTPLVDIGRGRGTFQLPARDILPPLERYARLAIDGEERLVGAVEATHGCRYRCRHCPVPTVYDGAFRVVGEQTVLADIDQLVEAGAQHITFADPDFLNGPAHALRILHAMHDAYPELTFDCTVKVEHILRHEALWPELAAAGCLFVVTAVECVNDKILELLDKGHTAADAGHAVHLLRRYGIEPRPSLMPFTPWTTLRDVEDIFDFVAAHDLQDNIDPVQYTIRLLIPEGSLLLERVDVGPYDAEQLSYTWRNPEPAVEELQRRLVAQVEGGVLQATGNRPRLTEPWFC